jgi:hypothetical protein
MHRGGTSMNLQEAEDFLNKKIGRNVQNDDFNPRLFSHQKFDLIYKTFVKYLKANFPPGPKYEKFTCLFSPYVKDIIIASRSLDYIYGTQAAKDLGIHFLNKKKEILPSSKKLMNKFNLIVGHIVHDDTARTLIESLDLSLIDEESKRVREEALFKFDANSQYFIIIRCFELQFKPSKFVKSVEFNNIVTIRNTCEIAPEFQESCPYMASLINIVTDEDEEILLEVDGKKLAQEVKIFIGDENWRSFLTHEQVSLRRLYVVHTEDVGDLAVASTDVDARIRDLASLRLQKMKRGS